MANTRRRACDIVQTGRASERGHRPRRIGKLEREKSVGVVAIIARHGESHAVEPYCDGNGFTVHVHEEQYQTHRKAWSFPPQSYIAPAVVRCRRRRRM